MIWIGNACMQAVPNTEEEIRAKLNQLKSELEPLEEVKTHVDSRIHRYGAIDPDHLVPALKSSFARAGRM